MAALHQETGLLLGAPVDVEHGPGFRVLELAEQGSVETHVERPAMQPGWAVFEELRLGPRMATRPGTDPDLLIALAVANADLKGSHGSASLVTLNSDYMYVKLQAESRDGPV